MEMTDQIMDKEKTYHLLYASLYGSTVDRLEFFLRRPLHALLVLGQPVVLVWDKKCTSPSVLSRRTSPVRLKCDTRVRKRDEETNAKTKRIHRKDLFPHSASVKAFLPAATTSHLLLPTATTTMPALNDLVPPGVITGDDIITLFTHARENGYAIPAVNCTR